MRGHTHVSTLLGLMLMVTPDAARAQAPEHAPTFKQSLSFQRASNPRISPDGQYVAYQVGEANWDEDSFETEIWIAEVESGRRYQLTNAPKSSRSPEWSPDSTQLAFLSDRAGKAQIYLISPSGGEARKLTDVKTGVNSLEWSPDSRRIAFTAADPESKERKKRKETYGAVVEVDADYTYTHLWVIEVPEAAGAQSSEPERLTEGREFVVRGFSWSPDSQRIAFAAPQDPNFSNFGTADLYVVGLADKKVEKLVDTFGPDFNPVWSPNGKQIAYETANGEDFFFYTNSEVAIVPAGGGSPRVLTGSFDEDVRLAAWGPQGIYFSALQKTAAHLFRLDPATKTIEQLTSPAETYYSSFTFSRDHTRMAFRLAAPNQFVEVAVSGTARFEPKRLTTLGDQVKEFTTATREVISWQSADGTTIEGVLLKPADFAPSKKYPLLVRIHGGPTGVDRPYVLPDRAYPLEQFAAKGAVILLPNYRGSAGYGEAFRSLNVRNLGVGDYWDVISGVDHLIEQGFVDPERVGAMGWSQGGYISAFITTYSDRFKAVSVGAGISDWMTYYVNTDIHPFTRQYLKATPWEDPEIYRKTSPISYVNSAQTPTLIQHGERDQRVPIPNAYELYQALQDRSVPVKMYVFPGFGHGIGKPKEARAVLKQNYDWFAKWIWGEEPKPEEDAESEKTPE